jgi:hypothetical protein
MPAEHTPRAPSPYPLVHPLEGLPVTTSFDDKVKAAQAAPPKTIIVPVLLDGALSERIAEAQAEIRSLEAQQAERLTAPDLTKTLREEVAALEAAAADSVVDLVFERLPGDLWADITARNPMRVDAVIDREFGYNVDGATFSACLAERGGHAFAWRLEDDGSTAKLTDEQWQALLFGGALSGHDVGNIRDAVFNLNEWWPQQKLEAAKKARAGRQNDSTSL